MNRILSGKTSHDVLSSGWSNYIILYFIGGFNREFE